MSADLEAAIAQAWEDRASVTPASKAVREPVEAALEQRLRARGTDSDEVIRGRMDRARAEISHWDAYDYVVINDDVEACFGKVRMILEAERMRRLRQTGLVDFVRELTR